MRIPRARFTVPGSVARTGVVPSWVPGALRSGRVRVRALMLLVGTCGAVLWSARSVFDSAVPVHRWAREIRQGNTDGRLEAARNLGFMTAAKDVGVAVPALAAGLGDEDESVAATAARSLGQTAQVAVRAGDAGAARTVIRALTGALKEPRPGVRAAAAEGLSAAAGAGPIGASTAESLAAAFAGLLERLSVGLRTRGERPIPARGHGDVLRRPEGSQEPSPA